MAYWFRRSLPSWSSCTRLGCLIALAACGGCVRVGFEPRCSGRSCTVDRGTRDGAPDRTDSAAAPERDARSDGDARRPAGDGGVGDAASRRDASTGDAALVLFGTAQQSLAGVGQSVGRDGIQIGVGVSGADGLLVYSRTSSEGLELRGTLPTDSGLAQLAPDENDVLGVFLTTGRAYLATYRGGLVIASIGTTGAQTFLGGLDLSGEAWAVQVRGGDAFVATADTGLALVDVSSPTRPALVRQLALAGSPHDVHIAGTTLYVAAMSHFHVLAIPSLAGTTVLASLDLAAAGITAAAYEVWSAGNYAYVVAKGDRRLLVIDVAAPAAPRVVTVIPTGSSEPRGLDGWGRYLVVGTGSGNQGSIQAYDLGDPAAPRMVAELPTAAAIYELAVLGCEVTAVGFDGQLRLLRLQPCL